MSETNKFSLKPVIIYLNELEEIFKILNTQFENNNLLIESENYIYNDLKDLSKSPEEIIYYLKIESLNDKKLKIYFVNFEFKLEYTYLIRL